jgi:predicted transcriptional regulator
MEMVETSVLIEDLIEELNLLERHLQILQLLNKEGPAGIMKLSQITGIPPHRVRYSLRILENEKMIVASPEGAKIIGDINSFLDNLKFGISQIEKRIDEIKELLNSFK